MSYMSAESSSVHVCLVDHQEAELTECGLPQSWALEDAVVNGFGVSEDQVGIPRGRPRDGRRLAGHETDPWLELRRE
jgi:hypothetical protein